MVCLGFEPGYANGRSRRIHYARIPILSLYLSLSFYYLFISFISPSRHHSNFTFRLSLFLFISQRQSLSLFLFLSFSFFVTIFLCPSIYLMGKNEEKVFNFLQKSLIPPQTFSFRVYFQISRQERHRQTTNLIVVAAASDVYKVATSK